MYFIILYIPSLDSLSSSKGKRLKLVKRDHMAATVKMLIQITLIVSFYAYCFESYLWKDGNSFAFFLLSAIKLMILFKGEVSK